LLKKTDKIKGISKIKLKAEIERDRERQTNITRLPMLGRKVELSAMELKEATFQIAKTQFLKVIRLRIMETIQNPLYFQQEAMVEED